MFKYIATLNGFKVGMVYANTNEEALLKASYLYGMSVDVHKQGK